MTINEKVEVLIRFKSRNWILSLLGITYPTLQHRLGGRYPWTKSEETIIKMKYDLAHPGVQLESEIVSANEKLDTIIGSL